MEVPRHLMSLLAITAWAGGCDHRDTPPEHAAEPVPTVGKPARPPLAPSSQPEARTRGCVVPMAADPPPTATHAANCPAPAASAPVLPRATLTFVEAATTPTVEVELALTEINKARGLMFRTELGPDAGMLFAWNDESPRVFWMRNTCIPLDMLFLDQEKRIVGILEQVPVLNDAPRTVPCPAQFVLELPAGYSRIHGIAPGQSVRIQPL